MKITVIKQFIDKHTKALNKIGQELEMTEERFAEINGTPLGIFVEEVKEKKPATKNKK